VKKSDLKQIIKPLVKECITEVLLEEGLLSNIVAEVASGLQQAPLVESRTAPPQRPVPRREPEVDDRARQKMYAKRKELMDAIGKDAYNGVNLFEGTTPMTQQEASAPKAGSVDLGNPSDAGVDISSLVGGASRMWDAMK
jgi:hypothetical protein